MVWSTLDSGFAVSVAYLRGFISTPGDEDASNVSRIKNQS